MSKPKITIIGLGVRGASLGLGLQRETGNFEIVGHDKDHQVAQQARKQGAVQRSEWNLHNACENADLIAITAPLSELSELFTHIREDLRPNTLVFAIVNVMQPAIELAAKQLPSETHFVVGHPVLSGVGGALAVRADLYQDVTFSLAPGLHTDPSAVQLASDFVERVGAKPLFVDAQEHDGIMAAVEQLPQLLAAALMRFSSASPGWREARRLAGRQFAQATELDASAPQLFGAIFANRANLLARIDQLQQELNSWRDLLRAELPSDAPNGAKHPLLDELEKVAVERLQWEGQAMLKRWDETPSPAESAEASGMLRQMLFGGFKSKRSSPPERKQ